MCDCRNEESESAALHFHPDDVDVETDLLGSMGKAEIEQAAGVVVSLCQFRGGWVSFTRKELEEFAAKHGLHHRGVLFGLHGEWFDDGSMEMRDSRPYLAFDEKSGTFSVTELFLEKVCPETLAGKADGGSVAISL